MMKKTGLLLGLVLVLALLSSCSGPGPEGYTVRTTPVVRKDAEIGSLDLRYYPASPHVPYYGLKAYLAFLRGEEVTFAAREDGTREITDPVGTVLLADPAAGTITAPDWPAFQYPKIEMKPPAGLANPEEPWIYGSDFFYDDAPPVLVFDLGKYGIALYADGEDVYLPIGILSTLFPDVWARRVLFNGETLLLRDNIDPDGYRTFPASFFESRRMRDLLDGKAKREEDEIREDYAELCFCVDTFFGHPGASALDQVIRERGLDETLKARAGDTRKALLSPDMPDFMVGLYKLLGSSLEDGHTGFSSLMGIYAEEDSFPAVKLRFSQKAGRFTMSRGQAISSIRDSIRETRAAAWGDGTYREYGSTAVIRLDEMTSDEDAWQAFYAGRGGLPRDAVGTAAEGLRRASENPAIRNVLFDVTANPGGEIGVMMAIVDRATGDGTWNADNVLIGRHFRWETAADVNLDGTIDEKDDEVRYDFNYAVLTSRASFSAANWFAVLMQQHGAVLLGEPSGGGSCCVQVVTLSGGSELRMSGSDAVLLDGEGKNIESCSTDLPIARIEPEQATHPNPRLSNGDYSPYFDDAALDKMITDWFAAKRD